MSLRYCQPVVAGLSVVLMRPRLYFYLHVDQRPSCSAVWCPETLLPLLVENLTMNAYHYTAKECKMNHSVFKQHTRTH